LVADVHEFALKNVPTVLVGDVASHGKTGTALDIDVDQVVLFHVLLA